MVGGSGGRTGHRVWGRGSAGQARVAWALLLRQRARLSRLGLLWLGLAQPPGDERTQGGLPCGDRILGYQDHIRLCPCGLLPP